MWESLVENKMQNLDSDLHFCTFGNFISKINYNEYAFLNIFLSCYFHL